jgi:hypothetical protein
MSETQPVDLATLQPGMDLCTFDFKKWGELRAVRDLEGTPYLEGVVDASGVAVYVPAGEVVETHGVCIRLTRPEATINAAGWDQRPQNPGQ